MEYPIREEAWFIWSVESVSFAWLDEQERQDRDPRTR